MTKNKEYKYYKPLNMYIPISYFKYVSESIDFFLLISNLMGYEVELLQDNDFYLPQLFIVKDQKEYCLYFEIINKKVTCIRLSQGYRDICPNISKEKKCLEHELFTAAIEKLKELI